MRDPKCTKCKDCPERFDCDYWLESEEGQKELASMDEEDDE